MEEERDGDKHMKEGMVMLSRLLVANSDDSLASSKTAVAADKYPTSCCTSC